MMGEKTVYIEKYNVLKRGYDKEILISKKYDEMNNIDRVLEDFKNHIRNNEGNVKINYCVSKTLHGIKTRSYNIK